MPLLARYSRLTPDQAVGPILAAASLSADAPSGTFIDRDGAVAW